MPDKKRTLSPSTGYDIQLKIKDLDYSNDLRSIRIVSSINTAYQIFTLSLSLDQNDIVLEDVLSKEPLKLSIKLIGRKEDRTPLEDFQTELQYVQHKTYVASKSQMSDKNIKERVPVEVIAICRIPFKIMTSIVNDVFFEKTPKQIIEQLVSKAGGKLEYDSEDENTNPIDQIILPPATLFKTIQYLDDIYGLFNGASNLGFCQYDNTVYVQNLTKRMTKNQKFTVHVLSTDGAKNKEIIGNASDGKTFYTLQPIKNDYSGSAKIALIAKNVKHIVKPVDKLFTIVDQEIDQILKQYGCVAKNPEIKIDSNLNDRESYRNNSSEIYSVSKIARELISLATVQLNVEKSLPILNLLKVGEPVKLKIGIVEQVALSGKYILKSSDINFIKQSVDWQSSAKITIMRSNQYI